MVVDPKVQTTWQPYSYADDDPLSDTDPTGLSGVGDARTLAAQDAAACKAHPKDCKDVGSLSLLIAKGVHGIASTIAVGSGTGALIAEAMGLEPVAGGLGAVSRVAGGVAATASSYLCARGDSTSCGEGALDVLGVGFEFGAAQIGNGDEEDDPAAALKPIAWGAGAMSYLLGQFGSTLSGRMSGG